MNNGEDAIEKAIGKFGRYQIWIYLLITVGRLPTEFQMTNVVFLLPKAEFTCLDEEALNATNYCPCKNPVYFQTDVHTSVTSEWNLICRRASLASLGQSMLQVGILFGSVIYGYISDRYGRKLAVLLALFCEALFGTVSALVPEFWMFLVCRFLIGTAAGGTMLCCYIITIELSGKSFRQYMLGLIEVAYVSGYILIPIVAYYVRDWRNLQLVLSVPWLLVIVLFWVIPESPRWLITVGRKEEAVALLEFIAKKNNLPTYNIKEIVDEAEKESINTKEQKYGSYLDLFRTPKMRFYATITAILWLCCSNAFFGINQYIGRLQGDLYLNVLISASFHVPGLVIISLGTMYLKRKTTIITSFCLASFSLLLMTFIAGDMHAAILALATIGQIGAYTSFVQVYLYTSEVFPTVIRNIAMGFCSVFGRIGGFIAPFVVNIGVEWVTLVIFGSIALFAGLLCFLLPETKNLVLLNTIEQSEKSSNKGKDNVNGVIE